MSSLGINFTGLASGIDTEAIIRALLSVERRPITLLQQRKTTLTSQKNLFGSLNSKLEALQDAVNDIRKSNQFLEFVATTDTDEFLTASAASGAAKGTHTVEVLQLARGKVMSSLGKADQDTTKYGAGDLELTINAPDRGRASPRRDYGDVHRPQRTRGSLDDGAGATGDTDHGPGVGAKRHLEVSQDAQLGPL